jgi:hypothetical protein
MLKIYQLRLKQNSFEVTLKYKGVNVRVAFEDGNTYNGTPAKCYTNNLFKQKAIESSKMFKDKEIVLERQVEEESDRKAAANKPVLQQKRVQKPAPAKPAPAKPAKPAPKPTPKPETPEPPVDPEPAKDGDGLEKKTFDNLAEAIQFIANNYQVQVTTPNEARNFLKEHGIKATIKQG